jgi:hypothetical protein
VHHPVDCKVTSYVVMGSIPGGCIGVAWVRSFVMRMLMSPVSCPAATNISSDFFGTFTPMCNVCHMGLLVSCISGCAFRTRMAVSVQNAQMVDGMP